MRILITGGAGLLRRDRTGLTTLRIISLEPSIFLGGWPISRFPRLFFPQPAGRSTVRPNGFPLRKHTTQFRLPPTAFPNWRSSTTWTFGGNCTESNTLLCATPTFTARGRGGRAGPEEPGAFA